MSQPNICILAFSDLSIDARVTRQIKASVVKGIVTVVALTQSNNSNVHSVILKTRKNILTKIKFLLYLFAHRYEQFYWSQTIVKEVISKLESYNFEIFIANDLETLPLAIYLAKKSGSQIFFDAHEYAPLEFENRWFWKYLHQPFREYLCCQYLPQVDVMTTVCDGIAKKYQEKYLIDSQVVLNVPPYQYIPYHQVANSHQIKLIHHGSASPERQMEKMIEMIPYLDSRFHVNFMLLGKSEYIRKLQDLAEDIAPGRVTFHKPVAIDTICNKLSDYDVGFYLLPPIGFNYIYSMPNKLFDFIMSGLCVAVAPSIEMKKIVEHYQCGVVASDFQPESLAAVINNLSTEDINAKKQASLAAAKILNAEIESQKIQNIIESLLK
ncbi:hypothetical protein H6F47_03580 [Sphaerospermopsis sp. FACHB-1094]|uniref:glycosyltransferase n=1 Tax=Sphaerospermopsis sp. FACHB-1094 TaxID=2692861 RepID=UPI0016884183|nr:hypothetical protein [Sphaerospermopsis sp. FACHB-1094]MBD2131557.1 hypothetical protein [Sphaerospermopsis sp. FACHB-1094]